MEDAARNVNEWLAGMGRGPCIVTRPLSLVDDVLEVPLTAAVIFALSVNVVAVFDTILRICVVGAVPAT